LADQSRKLVVFGDIEDVKIKEDHVKGGRRAARRPAARGHTGPASGRRCAPPPLLPNAEARRRGGGDDRWGPRGGEKVKQRFGFKI